MLRLSLTLAAAFCSSCLFVSNSSAQPSVSMSGLHVVSNTIQNGNGQVLFLHGVGRGQTEYECIAGTDVTPRTQAVVNAIKSWNANIVRVPLNEDCWLGINTNSKNAAYMGTPYRQSILNWVNLLTSNNLAVIVDLHSNAPGSTPSTDQLAMPDADHALAYWKSVAAAFKSNSSVIFDLFNEPLPYFDIENQYTRGSSGKAWQCWLKGGNICTGDPKITYAAVGMQALVNAVRQTGARNVLMLGGLQYSNDLTQWLAYKPIDPQNNLVASWHVYAINRCAYQSCWDSEIAPVAAQVPIIAGEFGVGPPAVTGKTDCNAPFLNSLWSFLDSHQLGYAAWKFNVWPGSCGDSNSFNWALISNEFGTRTPYGDLYYHHLQGLPSTH